MPYIHGNADSLETMLDSIVEWATDSTIHGDDAWTLMQKQDWPKGTILKAKGLDGTNTCYIGLMILDFTSTTAYSSWLLKTETIAKRVVWSSLGLNKQGAKITHTTGSASFKVWNDAYDESLGSVTYALSGYNNLVSGCGKMLVFGVFKQYSNGLDWDEQPGSMDFTDLGLFPLRYSIDAGYAVLKMKPPIYPGWGYPGIIMPSDEPSTGEFEYWLVKDGCHLTVVTNNLGQWDMGHAGMLKPFEATMQYPFPAVAVGSSNGFQYTSELDAWMSTVSGNKVDYSYNNLSISRGMPVVPYGINNSHVMLCTPDGTWKPFVNWAQSMKKRTHWNGVTFYFTLEEPTRLSNTAMGCRLKPMTDDLTDVVQCLSDDGHIAFEPLQLIQHDTAYDRTNLFGSLWGMHWPAASDIPFGLTTINDKKYLMLPNCWEDRLWYITPWTSTLTTQLTYWNAYKEALNYGKQFKMLIELEV